VTFPALTSSSALPRRSAPEHANTPDGLQPPVIGTILCFTICEFNLNGKLNMDSIFAFQNTYSKSLEENYRGKSFWLANLPEISEFEPLRGSTHCDIAIIGGGFTGLSTAYNTRKLLPGADVRVLEANICGFGSSGRNAGFASTLFGMAKKLTAKMFGKEHAIEAHNYMVDAVNYVGEIIHEHGINCDYEKSGSILVATTPAQVKRVDHELHIADSWGLDGIEAWDEDKLKKEFHSPIFHSGMFDSHTALLNPALWARGLMKIAKNAGARIYEKSPVVSIDEESTGFRIRTLEGKLYADRLVYATNAYSVLFPSLSAKQTPIFQHIVLSKPLTSNQLKSIGWQSRFGLEDARSQLHYFRLTSDNRILMGGGNISPGFGRNFNYDSNKKIFSHLEQHVLNVFPQLKGLVFTHRWGGPVSIAVDAAPVIGHIGNKKRGLFSVGLMGHGVSMAPYNGLCLAELLAGKKSKRTEMFFVGRRTIPWPPHVIRFPILQCVRGLLKIEDMLRWG
jgi:glycine/D-amino acid oxidase-like deaminating enzyme